MVDFDRHRMKRSVSRMCRSKDNDRFGKEILDGLCDLGRFLVFVDETGTSGKPLAHLGGDYVLICGVCMSSETYRCVKTQLADILTEMGPEIDEFHATEIVNPKVRSPWRQISLRERVHLFEQLAQILVKSAEFICLCQVSGEQYPQIMAGINPKMTYKTALQNVFLTSLHRLCLVEEMDTAIIVDSTTPLHDAIKIRLFRAPVGFYEGGVIYADSRNELGLQLADLAAFMLNRIHHIKRRQIEGKSSPFDIPIEAVLNSIRLIDLLRLED